MLKTERQSRDKDRRRETRENGPVREERARSRELETKGEKRRES